MQSKKFEMTLTRKGLFLLIAVLAIQLIFYVWLNGEVIQAESRAQDEDYSKTTIGRTNYASLLVSSCNLNVESYAITGDQKFLQRYQLCRKKLLNELHQMRAIVIGPKEATDIDRASVEIDKLLNLLDSISSSNNALASLTSNRAALESCWGLLFTMRQNFLQDVNLRFSTNSSSLPDVRAHHKLLQSSLLLVNIISGICVFAVFLLGIVKRLKVIEDNASRFSQKLALNQPIAGNDEVAKLDMRFHDMALSVERAQKQKEEYMSMLGHDVRSPLTSVLGSFELLRHDPDCGSLSEFGVEVLSRADRNVQRILKLVNEMLLVESLEAGTMQLNLSECAAAVLVESAIDSVKQLALKKQIAIVQNVGSQVVKVDRDRIIQVLINLLNNAIKFSPLDSEILVSVEGVTKGVKFIVSDSGRGVPENAKTLIFERFKQVKSEDASELGGAGLGLPICKMIVEAHGGSIGVESKSPSIGVESKSPSIGVGSKSPVGSCFWFVIPD